MAYNALATQTDLVAEPLFDLVRDDAVVEVDKLMVRASRAVETYCGRRLAPFTNVTESYRASGLGLPETTMLSMPLDMQGALGQSRAQSMGAGDLVRHVWLRQRPPLWPDQWVGSIGAIRLLRDFSGYQDINVAGLQYETDTGHVRFQLGTYVPEGTTVQVTYSGGYNPVPEDLNFACLLKVALLAAVSLAPVELRRDVDLTELREEYESLLAPYVISEAT